MHEPRTRATGRSMPSGARRWCVTARSTGSAASLSLFRQQSRCRSIRSMTGRPLSGDLRNADVNAIRRLVPRTLRHGVSAQLARVHAGRLDRDLSRLASGTETIVAGPWLGEVGFELLYWVPFLRWFADAFHVAPERLLVVSRGGTAGWYRPFAAGYREIFDYLTPEDFKRRHDERVVTNGEQK